MNRRNFLQCAAAGLGSLALGPGPRAGTARRPNVLFIFSDDQSFEALGAVNDEVHTPNLDRLAASGVHFTQTYTPGSWQPAVCVASRTMLLTGRTLWNAQAIDNTLDTELEAGRLWPQYLEHAGYDTYMTGKWHVNAPADQAFQHAVNVRPGMPAQTPAGYDRPLDEADYAGGWKPWETERGGFWEGGTHWSEVLTADAENFLEQAAARDRPFFMYLAFNAPHDPRQSPQAYVERYPVEGLRLPENFLAQYPDKEAIGSGVDLRDEQLAPFPRTPYSVGVHRQEYFAIVSHMDTQVGQILDRLEQTGQADNTVIIFSSDHGLAVGRHGLMGKQNMYEHSLRVPLIMSGPGMPAGTKIDTPVYLQDVMPTVLELAGVAPPAEVEFKSLLPLIANPDQPHHEAIHAAYLDLQRMVRVGQHKLVHYPAIDKTLLFDLAADPHELHNLADDPAHAATRARLWDALLEAQRAWNDPLKE